MGNKITFSGAHFMAMFFNLCALAAFILLLVLAVKAQRKYLRSSGTQRKNALMKRSLGEQIRDRRMKCKMTQEFVAESLGVSRQAVSKWETGLSDPSTTNLIALANLFNIPVAELIGDIEQ